MWLPYLQGKGLYIVDLPMNDCPASVFLVVIVNIFLAEYNTSCVWQWHCWGKKGGREGEGEKECTPRISYMDVQRQTHC